MHNCTAISFSHLHIKMVMTAFNFFTFFDSRTVILVSIQPLQTDWCLAERFQVCYILQITGTFSIWYTFCTVVCIVWSLKEVDCFLRCLTENLKHSDDILMSAHFFFICCQNLFVGYFELSDWVSLNCSSWNIAYYR